jgi:hypothetical protein
MNPVRRFMLVSLLLSVGAAAYGQSVITYHVAPQMADKTLKISMDVPRVRELTVRVQMPVWAPGAYFVGNFATNVADVSATDTKGKTLHVYHPDPNTWEISANGARAVQLQYTLKGADLEMAAGAPRRGHISGPRSYMYVVGRKAEPVELELQTPPGTTKRSRPAWIHWRQSPPEALPRQRLTISKLLHTMCWRMRRSRWATSRKSDSPRAASRTE